MKKVDVLIIGGGAGGLVVASVSAQLGLDTVLVESGKMGGDCLNYGCVPSKAIIAAGRAASERGSAHLPAGLPSWRLVEVSSASLLEDPVAVVQKLGAYLRIPTSDAAINEAARWLGDTQGKDPLASASSASMRIDAILKPNG